MIEVGDFGTEDWEGDGCDEEGRGEEGLKTGCIRRKGGREEVEDDVDGSGVRGGGSGSGRRGASSIGAAEQAVVAGKAHETDGSRESIPDRTALSSYCSFCLVR